MTVYVDDAQHQVGRMVMCHLAADTHSELLLAVDRIGVARRWIQHEGTWQEHFDISAAKRKWAVLLGAQEVTTRDLVAMMRRKREGVTRIGR